MEYFILLCGFSFITFIFTKLCLRDWHVFVTSVGEWVMCNVTEYYWDNVSNFTRIKYLTITVSNKLLMLNTCCLPLQCSALIEVY